MVIRIDYFMHVCMCVGLYLRFQRDFLEWTTHAWHAWCTAPTVKTGDVLLKQRGVNPP